MAKKERQATHKQKGPTARSNRHLFAGQADEQPRVAASKQQVLPPTGSGVDSQSIASNHPQATLEDAKNPLAPIRHKRLSIVQKVLITGIALIAAMLLYTVFKSLSGPEVGPASVSTDLAARPQERAPATLDKFEIPPKAADASSLRIAETLYLQKDFNKAYAVYNWLRQNLPDNPEDDPLRDFLQLKMAFCMKNAGDIEQADQLFSAVSQSCFPIVRVTASYYHSRVLIHKKQYLRAQIKAYQTIALIDLVDWAQVFGGPDRDWALQLARDCHFLAAECLTREILSLCDVDKALPAQLWGRSLEFDPFTNLDEAQLRRLLNSGCGRLSKALLAPQIQQLQRENLAPGFPQSGVPRWEVSCHGASIDELLARFAANAGLDIHWACDSAGAGSERTENLVIMRNRPVSLYISAATAQQFVTVAAGCAGLLARLDDEKTIKIFNPSNYTSLSEHTDLLSQQAVSLWREFLLTSGDIIERVPAEGPPLRGNRQGGLDPVQSSALAHFAVGLLQAQRGNLTDAIAEHKLVANRYPRTSLAPLALLHTSRLKVSLRDYLGARDDLKQLIEQYPDTKPDETGVDPDQACLYLADVTMKAGLLHQAAQLYGKVFNLGFSLESQRTSALGAGRCFYERQDYENAAYWLTRYINLWHRSAGSLAKDYKSRDFYLAFFLLGKAYIAQGQHQKAFDAFQHALSGPLLMQEYVEAVSALVKAYVKLGHFVKALELLENISSRQFSQKESIEILLLKASILRSAGLVDEAIAVLGDRAQYLPSSQLKTKIFFERARCSEARGDLEPARKSLTEILTLVEPGSLAHEVRYELADVCLKLGENTQAIFVCLQLLDSQPEAEIKQKALDLLATAYTRQKDYDKAALALLGQWKPVENTERELRTSNSELRTPSPIKQDIQHNEG